MALEIFLRGIEGKSVSKGGGAKSQYLMEKADFCSDGGQSLRWGEGIPTSYTPPMLSLPVRGRTLYTH